MDDLENTLKSVRLALPSPELDRRVDDLFAGARRPPAPVKSVAWWWLAGVAAAGGIAALVLLSTRIPPSAASPAVYRIEAQGQLRDLLVTPPAGRNATEETTLRVATP